MRLKLPVQATPDDDHGVSIRPVQPDDQPLNAVTRYLSAAAHLRKAMLPVQISDVSRLGAAVRPPHPVGRSYAIRVLLTGEADIPMPAVDHGTVRRNCLAALLQTLLRDIAALGVLIAAAVLQPLGTLIAVLVFVILLIATARRKVPSAVPIGVAFAIVLTVIAVNPSPRNPFFAPLIGFAALFLLATADFLWSAHRVRGLWRQTAAAPVPTRGSNVYYNKHGFIGSGIARPAFPLTVPLDKAKDKSKPVQDVTANNLLAYIGSHLETQGVSDGQPHGYAHEPTAATSPPGQPTPPGDVAQPRHFTYGLPDLDVDRVVAVPLPPERKVPFTRFSRRALKFAGHPAAADMHRTVDKSPSGSPDRHYVRAMTTSWDGQLVVSVFVSAALQGHFLQVVIRPYVIAPIGPDLKAADSLVERPPVALVLSCLAMPALQLLRTTERVRSMARDGLRGKAGSAEVEPVKDGLLSIRERYAQRVTDNIYHLEDAARLITVMEEKVIRSTMRYLETCNIDVNETEARIMTTFVQNTINGAGNIVVDSSISQSAMTATSGHGNTTNVSGGPAKP